MEYEGLSSSSDFTLSEVELIECLKKIDGTVRAKSYAEVNEREKRSRMPGRVE